jgi:hypothetical protein
MPKSSDFSSLPDQAILEKRFAFIDNDILKTNIAIAFIPLVNENAKRGVEIV